MKLGRSNKFLKRETKAIKKKKIGKPAIGQVVPVPYLMDFAVGATPVGHLDGLPELEGDEGLEGFQVELDQTAINLDRYDVEKHHENRDYLPIEGKTDETKNN